MKLLSLLQTRSLIFVLALFSSCKEDEDKAAPVLELATADQLYSLKNAQIFFMGESETEGGQIFLYRRYIITDGEIISGNGFSKDHYENATYFVILQLGIPAESEWTKGEFLQYLNWGTAPNGANVSFLTSNFNWNNDRYYTTHSTEHAPLTVSGGFDPGEKISIKFSGNVQYQRFAEDNETWLNSNEACTLSFTGIVVDGRQ